MFFSARWKAYLKSLYVNSERDIYVTSYQPESVLNLSYPREVWIHIYGAGDHLKNARGHLKRCDMLLSECATTLDALEETLANTPKPSEMLNWDNLTLRDLM